VDFGLYSIGKICVHGQTHNKAWVALGKFLPEFVYFAAETCHRGTLPSATSTFPVGKNFKNWPKHQRHRSAWVGQADFRKLQLNNRNHSGNCQLLSVNENLTEHFVIKLKKCAILLQFALILCHGRTWILQPLPSVAVPHFFRWLNAYIRVSMTQAIEF